MTAVPNHTLGCLAHPGGPDAHVGDVTLQFVQGAPWIVRRVDTVTLLDVDSLLRRSTVDVAKDPRLAAFSQLQLPGAVSAGDRTLIVPIAMLRKDLLAGFDVRNSQGDALSVVSRAEDSFCAWSALMLYAQRVVPSVGLVTAQSIAQHLYDIVTCFPDVTTAVPVTQPAVWSQPTVPWSQDTQLVWERLAADREFRRLLLEFTYNFALLVRVPATDADRFIVKFAYREWIDASDGTAGELLSLQTTIYPIQTPAAGTVTSYHLQLVAPNGLVVTDLMLLRTAELAEHGNGAEQYHRRLGIDLAQIYTSEVAAANYSVAAFLRVPVAGHLRALWITAVVISVTLALGLVLHSRLLALTDADAAVGILLIAPTLVTAYLLRPDEHLLAAQLLRFPRYASGLAGLMSMTCAAIIALGFGRAVLVAWWAGATVIAVGAAAYLSVVVELTRRDITAARRAVGYTTSHEVVDATERSGH